MSFYEIDSILLLNFGMCITCFLTIIAVLIKSYSKFDWDTKVLLILQLFVCLSYLYLETSLAHKCFSDGADMMCSGKLYWVIFEAIYFAVATLLVLKIYHLKIHGVK